MKSRKEVEDRILHIVSYIHSEKMLNPLTQNLEMFSHEELLQLLDFLETGDYKPIYILLDKKIKEYLSIVKEIKQIQIGKKMNKVKENEKSEKELENKNIEKMLIF